MDKAKPDKKPFDKRQPKQPRKISRRYLENAALYYLQRYASSAENLRRVMTRKIDRSCKFHETDAAEFYPFLDELIVRYTASGLLNDQVFAEAKVSSLRRQGRSKQAIFAKLQVKGLSKDDIGRALQITDEETGDDAEFQAALKIARRKKIGPFRKTESDDPKLRQKELAVLGRAGFSFDVAQRALNYKEEDF